MVRYKRSIHVRSESGSRREKNRVAFYFAIAAPMEYFRVNTQLMARLISTSALVCNARYSVSIFTTVCKDNSHQYIAPLPEYTCL